MSDAVPNSPPQRSRGRPRGFDPGAALDAAVRVFWRTGYAAASVDTLCREMHMPRASLYQLFGNKEDLFRAAIARYAETRLVPVAEALGPRGSLREDLEAFYQEVVALATRDRETPGCLISCVLADAAGSSAALRRELDARFSALEARIEDRLSRDTAPGDAADTRAMAGLLAAVARGIMLRARSGTPAADLHRIAGLAVASLCAARH
ncbi:TetR/AcrR family transcriptional regulator [Anianabacter salinae]|uniref:TetR/AcrR family transcriptional regulator n=1 Tax=Anianabacter salinae TaxID=2851023 RepID=UPI00225E3723|nr:TetR/AcrR family transcriptional regulator [Anianabacter salinae]MBV0914029.1 TetR/AcrR family transcriptional regulator [Anianabacter salinae]